MKADIETIRAALIELSEIEANRICNDYDQSEFAIEALDRISQRIESRFDPETGCCRICDQFVGCCGCVPTEGTP